MNAEYQEEARRLEELRRSLTNAQGANGDPVLHSWKSTRQDVMVRGRRHGQGSAQDPMIYPGLYAPSGFDMMGILIRVRTRPNPTIEIGNIDSGVALVLCDPAIADTPIVYCSESFEKLTGYSSAEILGRNCRFLQYPPEGQSPDESVTTFNEASRRELKEKLARGEEARVILVNYTKDGTKFTNVLTTIPIFWEEGHEEGRRYIVGFQADEAHLYRSRDRV